MESQKSRPDAESAQTQDESTDYNSIEGQSDIQPNHSPLSRRGALASVAGVVGLSMLSGSAQASHGGQHWRTDIDADGNALFNLGSLEMINNPTVGTTDNTALEGVVNAERFLRVAPTATAEAPNVLVGHGANAVTGDITGATISGGGAAENPNTVAGRYGTVGGGTGNTAHTSHATVAGGERNAAVARSAFVGGGLQNEATRGLTTVGGGRSNAATERWSTIGGGKNNTASGPGTTIGGGNGNAASGVNSTIGGGFENEVHAHYATIAGGGPFDPFLEDTSNVVYDQYGAIGGGGGNQAGSDDGDTHSAEFATVAGGDRNTASGRGSAVGGGLRNTVVGYSGTIGGGLRNDASGMLSTIGGGRDNTTGADGATVAGGVVNAAVEEQVAIGGGAGNIAEGRLATVGGGNRNEAMGDFATIGGGGPSELVSPDDTKNVVHDRHGTIGGGGGNQAGSTTDERLDGFSTVAGGRDNTASGYAATVGGGDRNTAASSRSTVAGGEDNTIDDVAGSATIGGGEVNTASGRLSTIGGGEHNETRALYATIGGGGPSEPVFSSDDTKNVVYDEYGTVGGGGGNQAGSADDDPTTATFATVGGGADNTAGRQHATVGGGSENEAQAKYATIAGGGPSEPFRRTPTNNVVYDQYGTIGGGGNNQAGSEDDDPTSATFATVSGGELNTASGRAATVPGGTGGNAVNDHSFVWNDGSRYHDTDGDSIDDGLSSAENVGGFSAPPTGDNTFHVSATGGFRFITGSSRSPNVTYIPGDSAGWTTASTRTAKTNIDPVDPQGVLAGVEEMEVATWEYRDGDGAGQGVRHIGPMAEDFHDAVDVGDSDDHINSINADGVAFAAIQGLSMKLDVEYTQLRNELEEQADRIDDLERENTQLRKHLADVEDRLADLEATGLYPASSDD